MAVYIYQLRHKKKEKKIRKKEEEKKSNEQLFVMVALLLLDIIHFTPFRVFKCLYMHILEGL